MPVTLATTSMQSQASRSFLAGITHKLESKNLNILNITYTVINVK